MFDNRFDEFSDFFETINKDGLPHKAEDRFDAKFNDFFQSDSSIEINHRSLHVSYNRTSHFSTINFERRSIRICFNDERHKD